MFDDITTDFPSGLQAASPSPFEKNRSATGTAVIGFCCETTDFGSVSGRSGPGTGAACAAAAVSPTAPASPSMAVRRLRRRLAMSICILPRTQSENFRTSSRRPQLTISTSPAWPWRGGMGSVRLGRCAVLLVAAVAGRAGGAELGLDGLQVAAGRDVGQLGGLGLQPGGRGVEAVQIAPDLGFRRRLDAGLRPAALRKPGGQL